MALMALLADAPTGGLSGKLLWAALPLIGILLVGALVIYLFDRWRKRANARQDVFAPNDQLSHFRSLYEQGEMSREEFESVKALLSGQLRQANNVSAPLTQPPPAASEAPPLDTNVQATPPGPQSPPPPEAPPA
jgi:hypothetical protein